MKPKENPERIVKTFRSLNKFCIPKISFFFLVIVYDRVGDADKHSFETFGLGRAGFYAASHLKIEVKQFFMNTM